VRASIDRVVAVDVCTRPFRAQGPRIELERMGTKRVVHNYGHGGSGWSLSWGSAREAVALARATGVHRLAVIGCGAIGLTSAIVAQRAGLKVRIYTRERLPEVRSSWATGIWSPDSRVCTLAGATPVFAERWEAMARYAFRMYQNFLGVAGDPVEWRDQYTLSDTPFGPNPPIAGEPPYPRLEAERLEDLRVRPVAIPPGQHPFRAAHVRRSARMVFNLSSYSRLLMADFLQAGGEIVSAEFQHPRDFQRLPEQTLIQATGYGAKALLGDASLVPVRGQTARLIPQPEVDYGVAHAGEHVSMTPRRDGLIVQAGFGGDFDNEDTRPDRAVTELAVSKLAAMFAPNQG
jgi:glycine/D-amino acid oxidase-like deaminating enzyme